MNSRMNITTPRPVSSQLQAMRLASVVRMHDGADGGDQPQPLDLLSQLGVPVAEPHDEPGEAAHDADHRHPRGGHERGADEPAQALDRERVRNGRPDDRLDRRGLQEEQDVARHRATDRHPQHRPPPRRRWPAVREQQQDERER